MDGVRADYVRGHDSQIRRREVFNYELIAHDIWGTFNMIPVFAWLNTQKSLQLYGIVLLVAHRTLNRHGDTLR